jgi:hypothetical protein
MQPSCSHALSPVGQRGRLPPCRLRSKYGRKLTMLLGAINFLAGTALVASAFDMTQLIIGRVLLGFGVGFATQSVPLYLSEMAPYNREQHSFACHCPQSSALHRVAMPQRRSPHSAAPSASPTSRVRAHHASVSSCPPHALAGRGALHVPGWPCCAWLQCAEHFVAAGLHPHRV